MRFKIKGGSYTSGRIPICYKHEKKFGNGKQGNAYLRFYNYVNKKKSAQEMRGTVSIVEVIVELSPKNQVNTEKKK